MFESGIFQNKRPLCEELPAIYELLTENISFKLMIIYIQKCPTLYFYYNHIRKVKLSFKILFSDPRDAIEACLNITRKLSINDLVSQSKTLIINVF